MSVADRECSSVADSDATIYIATPFLRCRLSTLTMLSKRQQMVFREGSDVSQVQLENIRPKRFSTIRYVSDRQKKKLCVLGYLEIGFVLELRTLLQSHPYTHQRAHRQLVRLSARLLDRKPVI